MRNNQNTTMGKRLTQDSIVHDRIKAVMVAHRVNNPRVK